MALVSQPSARPTRKVAAIPVSGAIVAGLTAGIMAGINHVWPGYGDDAAAVLVPVIVSGATSLVNFVSAYQTRERG